MDLSVAYIAEHLEVEKRTVRYYIEKGYLKGEIIDGDYRVYSKDFSDFKEEYYYSQRYKNKSKWAIVDEEKFKEFVALIETIKNGATMDEIVTAFPKTEFIVPTVGVYEIMKRNKQIKEDREKGTKIELLAEDYNLSISRIEKILYRMTEQNSLFDLAY